MIWHSEFLVHVLPLHSLVYAVFSTALEIWRRACLPWCFPVSLCSIATRLGTSMYKQARMVRAGICSLPSLPRLSTHSERLIVRVLYVFSVAFLLAST